MPEPQKQEKPAPPNPFQQAVDRVREAAKWLIASFAAIGAAMIAGSQLSSLGKLDATDARFWLAILGVLLALGGVAWAIWQVVEVLTPAQADLRELGAVTADSEDRLLWQVRSYLDGIPELFEGHANDVPGLRQAYDQALAERRTAIDDSRRHPEDQARRQQADRASERARAVNGVVRQVLTVATWERLRRRFRAVRGGLFGAVAAAAIGIVLFAWAANPPEAGAAREEGPSFEAPSTVRVSLSRQGRDVLRDLLGEGCPVGEPLGALALESSSSGIEVVTLPTDRCDPVRVVITPELGTVVGASPVPVPSPPV